MSEITSGSNGSLDEAVAEVVDAFVQQVREGHPPEVEEVARRHPHIADILRRLLPALPLLQPPSESPPADAPDPSPPAEAGSVGSRLGDFRILGELGAGGMGVVYRAEQVSLRRPVALKVLPLAATLDPRQLQRFKNEAQAAASLQHPHIVPVYAIGCERGIHFYAMQLIDGLPLTAVIGQQRQQQESKQRPAVGQKSSGTAEVSLASTSPGEDSLDADASALQVTTAYAPPSPPQSPSALLGKAEPVSSVVPSESERDYYRWVAQVGVQAAQALDHAHQMGVVHRDVKPANLLLDGRGQVWVTDFGLAQVRQQEGGLTQTGDIVGTIRYMSPEQAMAKRDVLDQRTDIYSLGATLYELLALQAAFGSTDRQELLRQVISEEPSKPRQLRKSIPVDLETIILKAMEKRPQDRYSTAQELADDLRRFLDDQPIRARRPSLTQRAARWGRRNRALSASLGFSAAVVLVVSAVGAAVYAAQQRQLAEERQARVEEEERGRRQAQDSAERMRVLAAAEHQAKEEERSAKETERQAKESERLAKEVAENRLTQVVRGNDLLGAIFLDLDPFAEATGGPGLREQLKERVTKAAGQLDGEAVGDPLTMAVLQHTLGCTLANLGERGPAIELLRQARTTLQACLGPDHPDTLTTMGCLGRAYLDAGQLKEALPLLKESFAKSRDKLGPDHPATLERMDSLASAYKRAGNLATALPLYEQVLTKRKEKLGAEHPQTLTSMNNLAMALSAAGQPRKALPLLEEVRAKYKEKKGSDHPLTLNSLSNLAAAYQERGQLDRALPLFEQALAGCKEKLGADHPQTLTAMNNLASAYQAAAQLNKVLPLLEETLARHKEKLGAEHPQTLTTMNNLAVAYLASGQLARALPLFEQVLVKRQQKQGSDHPETLQTMDSLAQAYKLNGQLDRALPLFEQTLARRKEKLGADHPDTLLSMRHLAMGYVGARQRDKALPLLKEALAKSEAKVGPNHPLTLTSMNELAVVYWLSGQPAHSIPLLEKVLSGRRQLFGPDHPETLMAQANLAVNYRDSGQLERALPLFEDALQRAEGLFGGIPQSLDWIRPALLATYEQAGQPAKAEKLYRQLLQQAQRQDKASPRTAALMAVLGLNLLQQKKYAEAEAVFRECLGIREEKQPGVWTTFNTQSLLGGALLGQKKYAEAQPLLKKGYQGMKDQQDKIPPQGMVRLVEALERLVQLHKATGNKQEAARWRKAFEQEREALKKGQHPAGDTKGSKQSVPRR